MLAALAVLLGVLLRRIIFWMLASFIARILVGAGLALILYKFAAEPLFDDLKALILQQGSPTVVAWIGFLNLDKAITVICSAYVIRLSANAVGIGKK